MCTQAGGLCVYVCSVTPTYFSKVNLYTDNFAFLTHLLF